MSKLTKKVGKINSSTGLQSGPISDEKEFTKDTTKLFGKHNLNKYEEATPYTPPYKVYTALLTQTGTDAPVATVLENTLGTVSYEYAAEGVYLIKLNGGNFVRATTFILLGFPTWDGGDDFKFSYGLDGTDSPVTLVSAIASSDTPANGAFLWQPIEIRVYD